MALVPKWFQITRTNIRPKLLCKEVIVVRVEPRKLKGIPKSLIGKDYKKRVHNLNSAMSFRVLSVAFAPIEVIE